jgi:type IV secretion system protein VirD4
MSEFGDGIRLGFDIESGKVIRWRGRNGRFNGHMLLVGGTGEGKSRDVLVAAMIEAMENCSIICVEPKGSLCAMLYKRASEKGRVEVLKPMAEDMPIELPGQASCYSPTATLDPTKKGFTLAAERIAGIISDDGTVATSENAAHFKDRCRELIAGVIMHVCERFPPEQRNLTVARNVLTSANGESLWDFIRDATENGSPYVQQKLAPYGETDEDGKLLARQSKEVADVLSTARRVTSFIGNANLGPSMEKDDFRFAPLKHEKGTVFITIPAQHLANPNPAKWLRLIVDCALHELWSTKPGKYPVLFLLDEFSQYGAMPSIRSAMNLARGFGLVLWPVVQSLGDLKTVYGPHGWETFVSSAAVKLFMPTECLTTRRVVSDLSGIKTVKVTNHSSSVNNPGLTLPPRSFSLPSKSESTSTSEIGQPVVHPHDVGNIPPDQMLMRVRGVDHIIRCNRKPYWECRDLDGKWENDPYETEEKG